MRTNLDRIIEALSLAFFPALLIWALIMSQTAGAGELQRGDLKRAIQETEQEIKAIAYADPDAFDSEQLEELGVQEYICADPLPDDLYPRVNQLCGRLARLTGGK
jgi:hypothetical protein